MSSRSRNSKGSKKLADEKKNTMIRNRIHGMYKDFVSEVDISDILDLLTQEGIVAFKEYDFTSKQATKKERCRGLISHLMNCSHKRTFIVLRKALKENYRWIVERIDGRETEEKARPVQDPNGDDDDSESDYGGEDVGGVDNSGDGGGDDDDDDGEACGKSAKMNVVEKNAMIRNKVVDMFEEFAEEVDLSSVLDHLVQTRIVSIDRKDKLLDKSTKEERCQAVLDHLLYSSNPKAFVFLREALQDEHPSIVERIDRDDSDDEIYLDDDYDFSEDDSESGDNGTGGDDCGDDRDDDE